MAALQGSMTARSSSIAFKSAVSSTQALRAAVSGALIPRPPQVPALRLHCATNNAPPCPLTHPQAVSVQPRCAAAPLVVENRVRVRRAGGGGSAGRCRPRLAGVVLCALCCCGRLLRLR